MVVWWEFRSLPTWGNRLLCSLVVQEQVLLYVLSDDRRVNRMCLGGCCLSVSLGSMQTVHWCHWCCVDGSSDVLGVSIAPLERLTRTWPRNLTPRKEELLLWFKINQLISQKNKKINQGGDVQWPWQVFCEFYLLTSPAPPHLHLSSTKSQTLFLEFDPYEKLQVRKFVFCQWQLNSELLHFRNAQMEQCTAKAFIFLKCFKYIV